MAETTYSYTKDTDVPRLKKEIAASDIVVALKSINLQGTSLDITFKDALSDPGDKQLLDTLITAHDGTPLDTIEEQRDSDGALIIRPKVTKSGRIFQARCIEIVTSEKGSAHAVDWDGNEVAGEMALRFFDKDGVDITSSDQSVLDDNCCMTELDVNFAFNYDVFRARVYILEETSEDCRIWCRMVPSVPAEFGGSKEMLRALNVKFMTRKSPVMIDGTAPTEVINGSFPGPHFTKRFRHKPGQRVGLMIEWQLFK